MNAPYIPEPGDWPCQRAALVNPPPRLLAAVYVLMRDHVQPGELEQVMLNVHDHTDDTPIFTNPHLEAYSRSLCQYLLEMPEPSSPDTPDQTPD